jgi:hypothetical protein
MATVKHPISEHDVIVLREGVGGWSASTTGAVIQRLRPRAGRPPQMCQLARRSVSAALVGVVDRGFHQQRRVTSDLRHVVAWLPAARRGCARPGE